MVHIDPVETGRHVRAANRDQCVGLKLQFGPDQRAFQTRSARRIADQLVGSTERVLVECAGRRDAQVVIPFAAQILN